MSDADQVSILVVDDLQEKLLVCETVLNELGENLVTARSGEEALKLVLKQEFAVILLDVNMPGLDGFETAALIRQRKKSAHTPIIFITAFTDEMRAAQGYALGAVDYILAPVVPEVLRAKVKVFVELFRMTQQVKRQAAERIALAEERIKRAEAEETNRRLSFLTRVGAVLGQSLDYESTVRDVVRLPIPLLADVAVLAHRDFTAGNARVTVASDGTDDPLREETVDKDALPQDLAAALNRAFAGDESLWDPSARPETVIALPLRARGRTFAALAMSRRDSRRAFGAADRADAEALVARAAIALDNASLYKDVQKADHQKNEFLSMLAHELRNPLAPIRNAVAVLRMRGPDLSKLNWARDVIDRQVDHMVRLVDDLLDISRITRGKIRLRLEPVELAQVVHHAVEASRPLIDARRHSLEIALPPQSIWIRGDAARMAQILTNLLNNAAKYTPESGRIWLSANPDKNDVIVRVRDNGVGIAPEMLSTIFDLFTQVDRSLERSEGGLGIGLTLVQRLVEMHGGAVQALSEGPGRGSEFVIRFSTIPSASAELPTPQIQLEAPKAPKRRVLVVDDNIDGGASLGTLLQLRGHEVCVTHDGPSALRAAQSFGPHIVLLDIGLPGMDGYEVARRLRDDPAAQMLLVAVTGYGREEDRLRAREAGFDHHLVKPIHFDALQNVILSLNADSPAPVVTQLQRHQ